MSRWLKNSISIFLGAIILLMSSGLSIAKMVCLKSGHTAITLNVPDNCCKHEPKHAPATFEEKCCDVSNLHIEKLQYVNAAQQNIEKSVHFIELPSLHFGVTAYTDVVIVKFRERAVPDELSIPPLRIFAKSLLI